MKQGDALLPLFFNLILEVAVRENHGEYQGYLAYADDVVYIVILVQNKQDIQKATESLIRSAMKSGLIINESKTKYT